MSIHFFELIVTRQKSYNFVLTCLQKIWADADFTFHSFWAVSAPQRFYRYSFSSLSLRRNVLLWPACRLPHGLRRARRRSSLVNTFHVASFLQINSQTLLRIAIPETVTAHSTNTTWPQKNSAGACAVTVIIVCICFTVFKTQFCPSQSPLLRYQLQQRADWLLLLLPCDTSFFPFSSVSWKPSTSARYGTLLVKGNELWILRGPDFHHSPYRQTPNPRWDTLYLCSLLILIFNVKVFFNGKNFTELRRFTYLAWIWFCDDSWCLSHASATSDSFQTKSASVFVSCWHSVHFVSFVWTNWSWTVVAQRSVSCAGGNRLIKCLLSLFLALLSVRLVHETAC